MPEKRDDGLLFHPHEFDLFVLPPEYRAPVVSETIQDLKALILEHGQITPIVIRWTADGRPEVVAGRRRLDSIKEIAADPEGHGVLVAPPVWAVEVSLTDTEAIGITLAENDPRGRKWDAVDQAFAMRALVTHQRATWEQAAERIGVAEARAYQLKSIFRLPQRWLDILIRGWITESNARELLGLDDAFLIDLAERVFAETLTVDEALRIAAREKHRRGTAGKRNMKDLRERCSKNAKLAARVIELYLDGIVTDEGFDRFLNFYPDPKAELILDQCRIDTEREAA